ncbi:MAG TPA: PKD domain-containing protein [Solirubrobacteraceae bacterium]
MTLVGDQSGAQVARTWPVGGTVPAAGQTLASNCSGAFNQLAEAPNGDVIAGFDCSGATFARRLPGGWRPASTPIPDTAPNCGVSLNPVTRSTTSDLRVAIDAAGDPFAVALEAVRTLSCPLSLPTDTFALNLLVGAGTSVQPAAAAVATGVSITAPDVAAGGGSALVSWSTPAVLQSDQHVRGFNPSGTPVTPAQVVGQSATSARGVLALSESGYGLDAFPRPDGSVVGTFRAPRGAFGPPVTLGSAAGAPSAAIDDAGDGLAGFAAGSGATARARISGFDATPPQLTLGAIPARATAGVPATFSASASDFWGPVAVVWNFGDGSTARGSSVKHVYAAAGHLTVTATAFDAVGNSVSAATAVGVGRSVPIVSNASETHSTFRVGSARTAIRAAGRRRRTPVGTTFGFTLNVDAAVAVRIDHAAAGLVSGHRCVAPSRRLRASNHRHCSRIVVDGTLQRHGHRGGNRIGFSGRIGRRALGHGAHRTTIVATAAGASGRSRHLNFVIVP